MTTSLSFDCFQRAAQAAMLAGKQNIAFWVSDQGYTVRLELEEGTNKSFRTFQELRNANYEIRQAFAKALQERFFLSGEIFAQDQLNESKATSRLFVESVWKTLKEADQKETIDQREWIVSKTEGNEAKILLQACQAKALVADYFYHLASVEEDLLAEIKKEPAFFQYLQKQLAQNGAEVVPKEIPMTTLARHYIEWIEASLVESKAFFSQEALRYVVDPIIQSLPSFCALLSRLEPSATLIEWTAFIESSLASFLHQEVQKEREEAPFSSFERSLSPKPLLK